MTHGKLASAVVVRLQQTYGAPASVENIHNYRILSRPTTIDDNSFAVLGTSHSETTEYQSFPIAAATYDPSTSTVTLTLKRPTKASKLYRLSSARTPLGGHKLTDLQVSRLLKAVSPSRLHGEFSIGVRQVTEATSYAPGPTKSTMRGFDSFIPLLSG